jgi:hypothetical protein
MEVRLAYAFAPGSEDSNGNYAYQENEKKAEQLNAAKSLSCFAVSGGNCNKMSRVPWRAKKTLTKTTHYGNILLFRNSLMLYFAFLA